MKLSNKMSKNNSTIQKGWRAEKLGDILSKVIDNRGKTPPISLSGHKMLEVFHLSRDRIFPLVIDTDKQKYVSDETYKNWFRSGHPTQGDILVSTVGTIAQWNLMPANADYCIAQNIVALRPDQSKVAPKFLIYYFNQNKFISQVKGLAIGAAQPSVKLPHLLNLEVDLPPLETQRRIASILSSFDEKIENNNRIIIALETMAQGIFKEWFVKFRFPGYKKMKFVDSETGKIPKGWEVKRLDEIADVSIGRTPPREQTQWFTKTPHGMKWISIRDLGQVDKYIFDTAESLTEEAIKKFNIPVIPSGTIVISFKLTLGKMAITTERMTSNEAIAHLVLNKGHNVPIEYLFMFLKRIDLGNLGSTSSIGTAINSKTVKRIEVIVPDKIIVRKFEDTCGKIFAQMKSIAGENQKLILARDSLLPKLMSGKLLI